MASLWIYRKIPGLLFRVWQTRPSSSRVNDRPTPEGARKVILRALPDETRLRHLAWIESNRKRVEEKTNGRVGYIYVRSTGRDGQAELVRQFVTQFKKEGLIIDERFNSGGQLRIGSSSC